MAADIGKPVSNRVSHAAIPGTANKLQNLRAFASKNNGKAIEGEVYADGSISLYTSKRGFNEDLLHNPAQKQQDSKQVLIQAIREAYEDHIADATIKILTNKYKHQQHLDLTMIDDTIDYADRVLANELHEQLNPSAMLTQGNAAARPSQSGARAPSSGAPAGRPSTSDQVSVDPAHATEGDMAAALEKSLARPTPLTSDQLEEIGKEFVNDKDGLFDKAFGSAVKRQSESGEDLYDLGTCSESELRNLGINRDEAKSRIILAFRDYKGEASALGKGTKEQIAEEALIRYFEDVLYPEFPILDPEAPDSPAPSDTQTRETEARPDSASATNRPELVDQSEPLSGGTPGKKVEKEELNLEPRKVIDVYNFTRLEGNALRVPDASNQQPESGPSRPSSAKGSAPVGVPKSRKRDLKETTGDFFRRARKSPKFNREFKFERIGDQRHFLKMIKPKDQPFKELKKLNEANRKHLVDKLMANRRLPRRVEATARKLDISLASISGNIERLKEIEDQLKRLSDVPKRRLR